MYTIIGQRDIPVSSVGKTDPQFPGQILTAPGKGVGIVNELLAGHPFTQGHGWRCDQQELASVQDHAGEEPLQFPGSLLRASALEQIVGAQHDDQQICVLWKYGSSRRNLPAILSHVADRPSGFGCQNIYPSVVGIISPAEPRAGIVAVGVGVAETDDVHSFWFLSSRFIHILNYTSQAAAYQRKDVRPSEGIIPVTGTILFCSR